MHQDVTFNFVNLSDEQLFLSSLLYCHFLLQFLYFKGLSKGCIWLVLLIFIFSVFKSVTICNLSASIQRQCDSVNKALNHGFRSFGFWLPYRTDLLALKERKLSAHLCSSASSVESFTSVESKHVICLSEVVYVLM